MKKIKSLTFVTLLFLLSLLIISPFIVKIAKAASTGTVAATVTAQIFSVSLDNGDGIAFGVIPANSAQDTTTNGVNDSTTATNNGSVAAKFNIKAVDSTGGAGWILASSAGSEQFVMKFCTATCDATPSWTSVGIHPAYATLAASVAKDGTQVFDLQIGTPVSTVVTAQQAITVTVQAVLP